MADHKTPALSHARDLERKYTVLMISVYYYILYTVLQNVSLNCAILHKNEWMYFLLLSLKRVSSARLGESDIHPVNPKTPAPQYQPIDRKKRKGKRVEDYSRDRAA